MLWAVKEKAKSGRDLTQRQRARNRRFGKVRAKVEHVFRVAEMPVRLPQGQIQADTLLADKAFDADKRVIEPLLQAGKTPVIPSMPGRKPPTPYDRDLFVARHLIENFFCKLKQFRAIATRYDKRAMNFLAGRLRRRDIHLAQLRTRP